MFKWSTICFALFLLFSGNVFAQCLDGDLDGVCDSLDNCPAQWQPNQKDSDGDGIGDWCDDCQDKDHDSVCADVDNCPCVSNPLQLDADENNIGDACDPDNDNDGVLDDDDNCPINCNSGQLDADEDGIGDVCDSTPGCGPGSHTTIICEQECGSPEEPTWEGSEVTGTVWNLWTEDPDGDNSTFAWPDPNPTNVSLENIEFTTNRTKYVIASADITSNTLTLKYEHITPIGNIGNIITYPPLIYIFEFENDINFTAVNLFSGEDDIILGYTSNSITLEVPTRVLGPGDIFTTTYELIF